MCTSTSLSTRNRNRVAASTQPTTPQYLAMIWAPVHIYIYIYLSWTMMYHVYIYMYMHVYVICYHTKRFNATVLFGTYWSVFWIVILLSPKTCYCFFLFICYNSFLDHWNTGYHYTLQYINIAIVHQLWVEWRDLNGFAVYRVDHTIFIRYIHVLYIHEHISNNLLWFGPTLDKQLQETMYVCTHVRRKVGR